MRIVAILAGAAAIALTAASSAAPAPTGRVLAISTADAPALVWVDAATLTPLPGPTAPLPRDAGGGFLSPDGSTYVVGSYDVPTLTFFDLQRMQLSATLTTGKLDSAYPIAWPQQRRLYVEGATCCPARSEIVIVDPTAPSMVARVALKGSTLSTVAVGEGTVSLLEPTSGIKPARIVTINPDGGSRAVTIARIKTGIKWRGTGANRRASIRQPALAVDDAQQLAYVIDSSGLVAEVDLATLGVAYHARATRRLARAAKEIDGPMLSARWAGDGHIAVSGTNAKLRKTPNGWRQTWTPVGVSLLDTRTWTSRMLDPAAGYFSATRDTVLTTGSGAVNAYELDGTLRYTVSIPSGDAYVSVVGDYAYAWTADKVTIIDLRLGTVVATLPRPSLYLITADS